MMDFGMGAFGMVLFWGVIVAAVIFAVHGLVSLSKDPDNRGQSHIDVLKSRYAAGQITREEFDRIKKDLETKE